MRRGLIYLLYWTLQAAAFPLLLLYLAFRIAKNRDYARRLGERFGSLPPTIEATLPGGIWLHAVSVGEVLSSVGLLRKLKADLPGVPLWVSTTTLAGRAMADDRLAGLADGIFFPPLDYRFAVRRVLRRIRPAVVAVMETEIWPNLYREARLSGARLLVVNGRVSDKAWPSYERWRWFFAAALTYVDRVLAQGPQAADRYRALGAAGVIEAGNLKYDFDPDATHIAEPLQRWLDQTRADKVWIAASTMPGEPDEDDLVIGAVLNLHRPGLLTILVPRKPERFDEAAAKLSAAGVPFVRRSALAKLDLPGVLLLDSMGELAGLFRVADVVFMGGTFPPRGGHNILEPAAFGKPVVIGPHMENFPEIAGEFRRENAVLETTDLAASIGRLLDAPGDYGAKGARLAGRNRGATAKAVDEIRRQLRDAFLLPPRPWWRLALLGPLTPFWRAAVALDRWRTPARRLPKPVISIGNLSAGGTGKTPFTLWLAAQLQARGHRPAVLTRGYKTAEEANLYQRAGIPVGIGADRYAAAQSLDAEVFLLDDGFQHWALHRDIDIVLIDALDPLAGGLLPLGRLREPWSALRRAGIVVSTRGSLPGVRFAAHVEPVSFNRPPATIGAFCGLGNPATFRRTLAELGLRLEFFEVFPDHHAYTAAEVDRMAARADALLTTEKDWLNLPDPARATPVRIRLRIENSDELLAMLEERLPAPTTGA